MKPARLLVVAGSDSGGGAGIQADIRTAAAFGVHAMTAVTAVTAQDTTGIGAIHLVPPRIVREQIERTLGDIGADAIKIGMLGSAATARAVVAALAGQRVPVIVDPVMVSTSGGALADAGAIDVLKAEIFARAALVTPNIPEASRLCGFALETPDDIARAGDMLLTLGPQAVLIKGGHGAGAMLTDTLFTPDAPPRAFTTVRIETRHTHGTGCTLSTAIACGLAQDLSLGEAVARAHAYVQKAIRNAPGLGRGNGPIGNVQG